MKKHSIRDYQFTGRSCITENYKRMDVGEEVLRLFKETGVKETDSLNSIINELLTEHTMDIEMYFGTQALPELIGKIYSKAKERYVMGSKSKT